MLRKKNKKVKIDAAKDIDAILDSLKETNDIVKMLIPHFKKLKELEQEHKIATPGLIHINIETQASKLETITHLYEYFQNDVDINGIRLKQITEECLNRLKKLGMKDLHREKSKTLKCRW